GDALLAMLPAFRLSGSRLVIYSSPPGGACASLINATDCCEFRGFVPSNDAWQAIQTDCDAVILPYPNPAGKLEQLYAHHFPSKLPEYLALGMPVIVTGPSYATGVSWALRNPDAVITHPGDSPEGIGRIFLKMRDEPSIRVKLAVAGVAAGDRDFDPLNIRK